MVEEEPVLDGPPAAGVAAADALAAPSDKPEPDRDSDAPPTTAAKVLAWRTRRRMAWTALISIIGATLLLMYTLPVAKLGALELVVIWFYGAMTSVVGAYFGFKTWANIKDPRAK